MNWQNFGSDELVVGVMVSILLGFILIMIFKNIYKNNEVGNIATLIIQKQMADFNSEDEEHDE